MGVSGELSFGSDYLTMLRGTVGRTPPGQANRERGPNVSPPHRPAQYSSAPAARHTTEKAMRTVWVLKRPDGTYLTRSNVWTFDIDSAVQFASKKKAEAVRKRLWGDAMPVKHDLL
jgi:hypothetical protein